MIVWRRRRAERMERGGRGGWEGGSESRREDGKASWEPNAPHGASAQCDVADGNDTKGGLECLG